MYTDPDEIFQQHAKSCTLSEVFAHTGRQAALFWLQQRGGMCRPAAGHCREGGTVHAAVQEAPAPHSSPPLNRTLPLSADKPGKQDLNRRTSSGNWIDDRVTWKEELNYKKAM